MATLFHGLKAYTGKKAGICDLIRRAKNLPTVEFCAADVPIGSIGVIVDGNVSKIFDADCYSEVDMNLGYRYVDSFYAHRAGEFYYQEITNLEILDASKHKRGKYIEAWVKGCDISAVWYRSDKEKKHAAVIARKFNVPAIKVYKDSHISKYFTE